MAQKQNPCLSSEEESDAEEAAKSKVKHAVKRTFKVRVNPKGNKFRSNILQGLESELNEPVIQPRRIGSRVRALNEPVVRPRRAVSLLVSPSQRLPLRCNAELSDSENSDDEYNRLKLNTYRNM